MRLRAIVVGIVLAGCQGPEEFHSKLGGLPPGTGGAGTLPVVVPPAGGAGTGAVIAGGAGTTAVPDPTGAAGTTAITGAAGTVAGGAGTTGAAGVNGTAGTAAAGTGAAGTSATAGTGGAPRDAGAPDAAGSGPRDAMPEAFPTTPYASTGWKPMASVTAAGAADVAANAFDGNPGTRWSTGRAQMGNETFTVDLGASRTVSRVVLDNATHGQDFPAAYTLEVSTNGTAFMNVKMGAGAAVTDVQFTRVMARHIRIRQTGTTPMSWWSIDELKVYP